LNEKGILYFFCHRSDIRTPSEQCVLAGLTVLEMCMLIGCKQVKQIYEDEPFNFEMAYHEFDKFASHKAKEV
jgi:origin recognition complex subunit 4